VATAFAAAPGGAPVTQSYAPSGLLRQRIAAGEDFEVFASTNMDHPETVGRERGRSRRASPATGSVPSPDPASR
jgi:ABC-type molybdate transport system substrate-binding protein